MRKELIKAFHNAVYESDGDLAKNIWNTLAIREKRTARLKFFAFSFIGFISLIGLVPAFIALFDDFAQSGFYEYLSLAFSRNLEHKKKHILIRHRKEVNNQPGPLFCKRGAMNRLLKPCFSKESGVLCF